MIRVVDGNLVGAPRGTPYPAGRHCPTCGHRLSGYNPGPGCSLHPQATQSRGSKRLEIYALLDNDVHPRDIARIVGRTRRYVETVRSCRR